MADDLDLEDGLDSELGNGAAGNGASAEHGQASESSYTLRDFFRSRGQELPDDLPDDAIYQQIEQWAGAHTRFKDVPAEVDPRELIQYADVGRQFAPHQAEIAEFLRSKQQGSAQSQPAAQQQPAQQPAKPAGPSDDDIRLAMSRCKKDEQGVWQPNHAFDADLARMLNDRAQRAAMSMEQFGTDPASFLKPHFQSMFDEYIKEKLEPRFQQYDPALQWVQQAQAAQAQQAVFGPRDAEYVVRDEHGGIAAFTPKGEALDKFIVHARQQFPNWPEQERLEWAALQADRAVPNATATTGGKGKLPFQGTNGQAAGQAANGKAGNGQQTVATGERPNKTTARRRSFVDAGRQRGDDGKFLPADRSATIAAATKRREPQGRGQTLEELYFAAKNGGE